MRICHFCPFPGSYIPGGTVMGFYTSISELLVLFRPICQILVRLGH
jgi:hypothetical protein